MKSLLRRWGFRLGMACAVLLPIVGLPWAAHWGMHQYFVSDERELALRHARNVLARSERVSQALRDEFLKLQQLPQPICSDDGKRRLQQVAMAAPDFLAIGYARDGRLLCSSYGAALDGVALGPVDFHGDYDVRSRVSLPDAPPQAFMAIEREGFVFLLYRRHVIDIPIRPGARLGTYSTATRRLRTSRGEIAPAWIAAGRAGRGLTFMDAGQAVAVLESEQFPTGVVVAIPVAANVGEDRVVTHVVTALALLAGLGVASWILLLARQRLRLSAWAIRRAMRRGELRMHYQPVVDLRSGRWIGAEALLRWRRVDGREENPADIVRVAERARLMERLTAHVLDRVAQDCRPLFARHPAFYVAVNLAAQDIASPRLLQRLRDLLRDSGGEGRNFQVEITENSLLCVDAAVPAIESIRGLGMEVVLDDFGTGFSNLQYLASFALDGLKIDRYFVQRLQLPGPASQVTLHIIELAHGLGLKVVAEGIESAEQEALLKQRRVARGQGWRYGRAMSLEALLAALEERARAETGG